MKLPQSFSVRRRFVQSRCGILFRCPFAAFGARFGRRRSRWVGVGSTGLWQEPTLRRRRVGVWGRLNQGWVGLGRVR